MDGYQPKGIFNVDELNSSIISSPVRQWHTKAVQKVSDLWSAKIQLFIWMSETLIPFKVVSLVMHTLPAVLPLLETFLESFLWNLFQQVCRVLHNIFSWLKSFPFQRNLQLGEQPEITRGHVGRVGSLTNQGNVVFSQKNLNQMRRMGGCVVVMELPSFAAHRSGRLRRTALRRRQSTPS